MTNDNNTITEQEALIAARLTQFECQTQINLTRKLAIRMRTELTVLRLQLDEMLAEADYGSLSYRDAVEAIERLHRLADALEGKHETNR